MAATKKPRPPRFADVVAALPEAGPPYVDTARWVSPLKGRELEFPPGVVWLLSQADPDAMDVRRRMQRSDTLVIEVYGTQWTKEIPTTERGHYWDEIGPYLTGTIRDRDRDGQTDFAAAFFEDAGGRTLVAVERYC